MPRAMKPVGKPEGNVVWTRSSGFRCAIRHRHGPAGNEPEFDGGDQSRDDASRVVADVMVVAEVPAQTRNRDQQMGRQRRRNEVVTNRDARLIAASRRMTQPASRPLGLRASLSHQPTISHRRTGNLASSALGN
jgi:hypothetical protein